MEVSHFPSGARRRTSSKKFCRKITSLFALCCPGASAGMSTRKRLPVRTYVQILKEAGIRKPLLGPEPWLLRDEGISLRRVGRHHDLLVLGAVEHFASV